MTKLLFLGNKNQNKENTIVVSRLNKLSLNEDTRSKTETTILKNLHIKSAAFVYQFVNLFNLPSLHKTTLRFIERCFTIVCDTVSFLELNYSSISKILASSSLLITSEVEVFNIAERWLNHNIKERSKYAKDILIKARLHLLSNDTIQKLLHESTFLKNDNGCAKIIKEMLNCREKNLIEISSIYQTRRYCNDKSFKLIVNGGPDTNPYFSCFNLSCVDVNNLEDVKAYLPMNKKGYFLNALSVKDDLYVFSRQIGKRKRIMSVDKYSFTSEAWSKVSKMCYNREASCACAFMDKVFIFGGIKDKIKTNSCLQFDTSDYSWKEVARMSEVRLYAACTIFEERVVVSGGIGIRNDSLKTVETFDVLPDKWSLMPSMNFAKSSHSLVVVKNKLFVLRNEDDCEVYDSIGKKFMIMKSKKSLIPIFDNRCPLSFDNKIYLFERNSSTLICYDVDKKEWSQKSCNFTRNFYIFSCVKLPCLVGNN